MAEAAHNHEICVLDAVAAAESRCARLGVRLTDLRRRVLELVWSSHKPITAYELLDMLRQDHRSAAPPTVYRALDFLLEHGLIHRIEVLNAFIGCPDPEHAHRGMFLICNQCRRVDEVPESAPFRRAIRQEAERLHFAVRATMVEVIGLCADCSAMQGTGLAKRSALAG